MPSLYRLPHTRTMPFRAMPRVIRSAASPLRPAGIQRNIWTRYYNFAVYQSTQTATEEPYTGLCHRDDATRTAASGSPRRHRRRPACADGGIVAVTTCCHEWLHVIVCLSTNLQRNDSRIRLTERSDPIVHCQHRHQDWTQRLRARQWPYDSQVSVFASRSS